MTQQERLNIMLANMEKVKNYNPVGSSGCLEFILRKEVKKLKKKLK